MNKSLAQSPASSSSRFMERSALWKKWNSFTCISCFILLCIMFSNTFVHTYKRGALTKFIQEVKCKIRPSVIDLCISLAMSIWIKVEVWLCHVDLKNANSNNIPEICDVLKANNNKTSVFFYYRMSYRLYYAVLKKMVVSMFAYQFNTLKTLSQCIY